MGFASLEDILPPFPKDEWEVPGFLNKLRKLVSGSVTGELLTAIKGTTKIPWEEPIIIGQNKDTKENITTTLQKVKEEYANVFSDWVDRYASLQGSLREMRGLMFAYKATNADVDGDYLGWFAQQLAFEYNADLVVMGHTHIPKLGLQGDIANYLNSGFECVSVPDEGSNKMTFSVITTEDGKYLSAEVKAITKKGDQYPISNDQLPKAPALGGAASDHSCYITVENKSSETYKLVPNSIKNEDGYFAVYPPGEIPANTTVKFWIQDFPGPVGSEGRVVYKGQNSGQEVPLIFRCTVVDDPNNGNANLCSGTNEFYSKSGKVSN